MLRCRAVSVYGLELRSARPCTVWQRWRSLPHRGSCLFSAGPAQEQAVDHYTRFGACHLVPDSSRARGCQVPSASCLSPAVHGQPHVACMTCSSHLAAPRHGPSIHPGRGSAEEAVRPLPMCQEQQGGPYFLRGVRRYQDLQRECHPDKMAAATGSSMSAGQVPNPLFLFASAERNQPEERPS
jgi:hypothetical protein